MILGYRFILYLLEIKPHYEIRCTYCVFFSAELNLARGKTTQQSSTCDGYGANRVVDGNYNTDGINGGSCSNTNDGPGGANWLMVDMGSVYTIGYVIATNRGDGPSTNSEY